MKASLKILTVFYVLMGIFVFVEVFMLVGSNVKGIIIGLWIILGFVLLNFALNRFLRCNNEKETLKKDLEEMDKKLNVLERELERKETEGEKEEKRNDLIIEDILIEGDKEIDFFKNLLKILSEKLKIVQGIIYKREGDLFKVLSTYAYYYEDENEIDFKEREGINGQVAFEKKLLILSDVPKGYVKVFSGVGESYPKYVALWPIVIKERTEYFVEFATFETIDKGKIEILKKIDELITKKTF